MKGNLYANTGLRELGQLKTGAGSCISLLTPELSVEPLFKRSRLYRKASVKSRWLHIKWLIFSKQGGTAEGFDLSSLMVIF